MAEYIQRSGSDEISTKGYANTKAQTSPKHSVPKVWCVRTEGIWSWVVRTLRHWENATVQQGVLTTTRRGGTGTGDEAVARSDIERCHYDSNLDLSTMKVKQMGIDDHLIYTEP